MASRPLVFKASAKGCILLRVHVGSRRGCQEKLSPMQGTNSLNKATPYMLLEKKISYFQSPPSKGEKGLGREMESWKARPSLVLALWGLNLFNGFKVALDCSLP